MVTVGMTPLRVGHEGVREMDTHPRNFVGAHKVSHLRGPSRVNPDRPARGARFYGDRLKRVVPDFNRLVVFDGIV